jgi:hypothetical protein
VNIRIKELPAIHALLCAVLACLVVVGCGNKQSQESSQNSAPAEPVLTLDPTTTGSISGKVVLDGAAPKPKTIDMGAEAACVQEHPTPVDFPEVVEGSHGALANVAVYVKSGLGNYHFDTPKNPVVLGQKGCMYDPHVLALMVNQPMQVVNGDPVLHNIHVVARDNRSWNRSETAGMDPFIETFMHPELAVVIKCNVHPWMRAFAFVFNHPYFDVTTKTGTFELKNLPPGTYTIEAWQEKYGVQDQTVTIGSKESKAISFTFEAAASPAR